MRKNSVVRTGLARIPKNRVFGDFLQNCYDDLANFLVEGRNNQGASNDAEIFFSGLHRVGQDTEK